MHTAWARTGLHSAAILGEPADTLDADIDIDVDGVTTGMANLSASDGLEGDTPLPQYQ